MTLQKGLLVSIMIFISTILFAQNNDSIDIRSLAKEDLLKISKNALIEMPFEDLMYIVNTLKLSSVEELYELILNPKLESASKIKEEFHYSPLDAIVITSQEITNSGVSSIAEALRLIPGLIVKQKTNGNYDVHIRGNDNMSPGKYLFDSENTITLVMIDNRPVYNYFQGGTFWEALPIGLNDIEQIEVVKGPSTALYGPNAMSGVINIITKKISDKKVNAEFNAQGGSFDTYQGTTSLSFNNKKNFKARVSGNYSHLNRMQDEYLYLGDYVYYPSDSLENLVYDPKNRYPDPALAVERKGLNAWFIIEPKKDVSLSITTGWQESQNQSIYLDINNVSYSVRQSNTHYIDLHGKYKGLNTRFSYRGGDENNALGYKGYQFDVKNLDAVIEYDINLKNLRIQPGVTHTMVSFDDRPYLTEDNAIYGPLFNGKKNIKNYAYYIRSEYTPHKNVKFVAALRNDHYSVVEKSYFTYQFAVTYKINDNNMLRMVLSKANRGPSMFDYHINYQSPTNYPEYVGFVQTNRYHTYEDLRLPTMQMAEIGYRNRIRKNIRLDFTLFHSVAKDFSTVFTDTIISDGEERIDSHKENLDLIAHQTGVTFNVDWMLHRKVRINFFSTVQSTLLSNFRIDNNYDYNNDGILIGVEHDLKHKSTPSYYGGLVCNYKPIEKLNINTNIYYYGPMEYFTIDGITHIDGKIIPNLKISYQISKYANVYFNGRNLFSSKKEFAFADDVKSVYLLGFEIVL